MSNRTFYTKNGLKKLGEIVRQARGNLSYREFEPICGVSHGTIRRMELGDVKMPDYATLLRLAPHTPYTIEEIQAIAAEREPGDMRKYRTYQDVLPMVMELPDQELAKLGQAILAKLAGLAYCETPEKL